MFVRRISLSRHSLRTKVNLQLWVKVRKEWRDSEILMKNYGYNPKE